MVVTKEDFKSGSNTPSQSTSRGKEGTLGKFLVFYGLLVGWCSIVIYSVAGG